jgi:hypothetical protein
VPAAGRPAVYRRSPQADPSTGHRLGDGRPGNGYRERVQRLGSINIARGYGQTCDLVGAPAVLVNSYAPRFPLAQRIGQARWRFGLCLRVFWALQLWSRGAGRIAAGAQSGAAGDAVCEERSGQHRISSCW